MKKKLLYLLGIILFSGVVVVKAADFTVGTEVTCTPSKVSNASEEVACTIILSPSNGSLASISISLSDIASNLENLELDETKATSSVIPGIALGTGWSYSNGVLTQSSPSSNSQQLAIIYLKVKENCMASLKLENITYTSSSGATFVGTSTNHGSISLAIPSDNGSCQTNTNPVVPGQNSGSSSSSSSTSSTTDGDETVDPNSKDGNTTTTDKTTQNPSTGVSLPVMFLIVMIGASAIIVFSIRKTNKFYKL